MDAIFKALNDPARRTLLDALRARDGQTLQQLESRLDMTRFGVMKHLKVLEDACLIVTRREGRFKYHYLNAVPLQEVIDRWIEPLLAKPAARTVLDLKRKLEGTAPMNVMTDTRPDFVHQTFIRTDAATLWHALVSGEMTPDYYIARAAVEGEPVTGGRLVWRTPDGAPLVSGDVLAAEPGRRLDVTFEPHWLGSDAQASRSVFLIEETDGLCKLTIEHYGLPEGQEGVKEGWARIASALKTRLETGRAM